MRATVRGRMLSLVALAFMAGCAGADSGWVAHSDPPSSAPALRVPADPLPELAAQGKMLRVPVLMYHHITEPRTTTTKGQRRYIVRPAAFRAQLQWLKESGYTSISLDQFNRALKGEDVSLPEKPIVLTFDDGFSDAYTEAFPILKETGFTAAFFVLSGSIRGDPLEASHRGNVSWEELQEMVAARMEVGSHSAKHPFLTRVSYEAMREEIFASKRVIAEHLAVPVRFFCYPYGDVNETVRFAVREAGYELAFKVFAGVEHPVGAGFLDVKRIEAAEDLAVFRARVEWKGSAARTQPTGQADAGNAPLTTDTPQI